jgi:hypothetical protein
MIQRVTQDAVLVHYHIFKNGGSTIDYVLEREFQSQFTTLHGPEPSSTLTKSDLHEFLVAHPSIRAVSSHHLRYPTLRDEDPQIIDICMLRHPLDRLGSVYKYLRHRHVHADDPLCTAARQLPAPEFFRKCLEKFRNWVQNVQVRWLNGDRDADQGLEFALPELLNVALLGTLDLFDESLVTWEYTLAPLFPGLSFHYLPLNMTQSPRSNLEQRLERFHQLCGHDLFDELSVANAQEIELFETASSIVKQRFTERAEAEHWLHEFRERNRRLEHQSRTSLRARVRNRLLNRDTSDLTFSKPGGNN